VLKFFRKTLGIGYEGLARKLQPVVNDVVKLEASLQDKTDEQLRIRLAELRSKVEDPSLEYKKLQKALNEILPEVFAITREASHRVFQMKHFPVQIMGGIILHQGKIAEMKTGEGKTLVATLPAVLNALTGRGVHVVTVNEYLARRDSEWMGRLYKFLGLSVGLATSEQSNEEKKAAYQSDILYATNNELGFDYLRDNMAESLDRQVRRGFYHAIVDEVDSVLIDEARTPLIISGLPETRKQDIYLTMRNLSKKLYQGKDKDDLEGDYYLEEKSKNVVLTDKGIRNAEKFLGVSDLWSIQSNLAHHLLQALKAKEFFRKDFEYVVHTNPETKRKEVVIVDEFTGRLMYGRRWSDGLHQAVEAKESVSIQEESLTLANITFQNFFKLYPKLSGMTGTALTEKEEFREIYDLDVSLIPTNKPNIRQDLNDQVYKDQKQKYQAILEEIIDIHQTGRPILVGTTSIERSELISDMLSKPKGAVETLKTRSDRLLKVLEELKPLPSGLVKDLQRIISRPVNIKHSQVQKVYRQALESGDITDDLRQALSKSLEEKDINDEDSDLVFYLKVVLKNSKTVELIRAGISHHVLNAKHHAKEAEIISQAGRLGMITIATNMAGRGTDILLGGNAEALAQDQIKPLKLLPSSMEYEANFSEALQKIKPTIDHEHDEVVKLGGLHVIATERHEARRIDNQLKGRAGRQGDPGSSRAFLALDDQLMRIFGGDKLSGVMDNMMSEEDERPIEAKMINHGISRAQAKVESYYRETRKRLKEYDDVQDTQRAAIYRERQKILEGKDLRSAFGEMLDERIETIVNLYLDSQKTPESWFEKIDVPEDHQDHPESEKLPTRIEVVFSHLAAELPCFAELEIPDQELEEMSFIELLSKIKIYGQKSLEAKEEKFGAENLQMMQRQIFLRSIDESWVRHLESLDSLREGIHLRGYGNKQPLIEYKTEAFALFDRLIISIRRQAIQWLFHVQSIEMSVVE